MTGPIHLYVSSSNDLIVEREAIGQVVAALPLTLGWQISHTPLPGLVDSELGLDELTMRIQSCDLYAVVLGADLTAPMGFELRTLLASGRQPIAAYRKQCNRSPSAQDALRVLDVAWKGFSTLLELRATFRRDLLRALLDVGPSLGLDLGDVERLLEDRRGEGAEAAEGQEDRQTTFPDRPGGADRSGRILGREVWQERRQD
jgi:hypothetical protein